MNVLAWCCGGCHVALLAYWTLPTSLRGLYTRSSSTRALAPSGCPHLPLAGSSLLHIKHPIGVDETTVYS
jgi:hypothetical protein